MDPLWADLINSDWHDHLGRGERADRLDDDRWLARFLRRAGWSGRRLPGRGERARLRALRGVLRRGVDAILAGATPAAADIAALNRSLAGCPAVRRLERGPGARLTLVARPAAAGAPRVLASVAVSFAELLASGGAERIKACANPDCRWVILDETRNGTRRWCEAGVCGSLVKVRRFRTRHRRRAGRAGK